MLLAAVFASLGLHHSLDSYLEERADDAAASAQRLALTNYEAEGGRWSAQGVDLLAHELVLTGYDFRLTDGGRVLLDTTRLKPSDADLHRVATEPLRTASGTEVGVLEMFALGPRGNLPADDDLRQELDRAHLLAAIAGGVIAIAIGLVVAAWLTRPLRELTDAARQISSGEPVGADPAGASPEVRDLAEALRSLSADLDRQLRSRRRLAQDLSHELRTPVSLIQGRIEAMQDGVVALDQEGLESLHAETLRLGRLIDRIERLAEAEARLPGLRSERLDLATVATEAQAALAPTFDARGIALTFEGEPALVRADPDAVRQILTNLLSNALKYAPPGEPVELWTGPEGGSSVLCVRDAGDGLAPGERRRVFERFERGDAAATGEDGVGLGLAIARELAEALGGTLGHDSSREGSTFFLALPRDGARADGVTPGD